MGQNQAILQTVLFDMGGTLDGDGLHWLDHFETLYARAGIALPRETRRAAFDAAERRAASDDEMSRARLFEMIDRHTAWQFEYLEKTGRSSTRSGRFVRRIVGDFVAGGSRCWRRVPTSRCSQDSKREASSSASSRTAACNVTWTCFVRGSRIITPFLSIVVDSRRVRSA